jgi:uncharacterized protein (DUF4415 family)
MKQTKRVTGSSGAAKRAVARRSRARTRKRRGKAPSLTASAKRRRGFQLQTLKIADFYRPLKKPVTLRLDADVIAWFKKDGTRYQTRINAALRKVMEREMKAVRG